MNSFDRIGVGCINRVGRAEALGHRDLRFELVDRDDHASAGQPRLTGLQPPFSDPTLIAETERLLRS